MPVSLGQRCWECVMAVALVHQFGGMTSYDSIMISTILFDVPGVKLWPGGEVIILPLPPPPKKKKKKPFLSPLAN